MSESLRVLVLEHDEQQSERSVSRLLTIGHTPVSTWRSRQAMATLKRAAMNGEPFDVALLDTCDLKVIDFIHHQLPQWLQPTLVVQGDAMSPDHATLFDDCLIHGIEHYIDRSVPLSYFERTIRQCRPRARMNAHEDQYNHREQQQRNYTRQGSVDLFDSGICLDIEPPDYDYLDFESSEYDIGYNDEESSQCFDIPSNTIEMDIAECYGIHNNNSPRPIVKKLAIA